MCFVLCNFIVFQVHYYYNAICATYYEDFTLHTIYVCFNLGSPGFSGSPVLLYGKANGKIRIHRNDPNNFGFAHKMPKSPEEENGCCINF
jgi:hypothetical protein